VQELFPVNSCGVVTARDVLTIHDTKEKLINTINRFIRLDTEAAREQFDLGKDVRDWTITGAKQDLTPSPDFRKIAEINYRPFDRRFTYYTGNSKGFHCMPRDNVMRHFLKGENVGLIFKRGFTENAPPAFVSSHIVDFRHWSRPGMHGGDYVAPLYLYSDQATLHNVDRTPNLDAKIVEKIAQAVQLEFESEKSGGKKKFAPIDVLDYIYAVLHSPTYREKYKEFLKIDFPRVPYPEDVKAFWQLVKLGGKLRRLHLMEGITPRQGLADYNVTGNNVVEKQEYNHPAATRHPSTGGELPHSPPVEGCPTGRGGSVEGAGGGRVYINDTQYFDHVSPKVWNFYIGGYQPAQKWLKDRKGKTLNFDDIQHYREIICVLKETINIMDEEDKVIRQE
jgi:predicted helicase